MRPRDIGLGTGLTLRATRVSRAEGDGVALTLSIEIGKDAGVDLP
jgi:hypothetical protein